MRISDWSSDVCSSDLAEAAVSRLEDRIAHIAGLEVVGFVADPGQVRNVVLAILSQIGSIRIDDRGGVVVMIALDLEDRSNDHHGVPTDRKSVVKGRRW